MIKETAGVPMARSKTDRYHKKFRLFGMQFSEKNIIIQTILNIFIKEADLKAIHQGR